MSQSSEVEEVGGCVMSEASDMSVAEFEQRYGFDRHCPSCGKKYLTSLRTYREFCTLGCRWDYEHRELRGAAALASEKEEGNPS